MLKNKVAIIGAGISGLSCAKALQNAGFNVSLFEKSRGVSGRLSTRVAETWQCDHGAQYFTARDARFASEVQTWVAANVAQLWQPRLNVFNGQKFTAKETDLTRQTLRYVGYPRNNAPAKWLAKSLHVLTESTVNAIEKKAQYWQINTIEHGLHPEQFDALVLAIPAPQAATLLRDMSASLFNLCNHVTMRPCYALMLRLNQSLESQFDGLFINTGILSWLARDNAKPGRDMLLKPKQETWVLHASSAWSQQHINEDKQVVAKHMLNEFKRIMQMAGAQIVLLEDATKNINHSANYDLHRWLYADCETYLSVGYQFDAAKKIGLCGDWLNGGKIQGAWLSGLQLAESIIEQNAG